MATLSSVVFLCYRAVRIMEQRYFEQRAMLGGMAPGAGLFDGYRKGPSAADPFQGTWLT
jgi:hypothetical protein